MASNLQDNVMLVGQQQTPLKTAGAQEMSARLNSSPAAAIPTTQSQKKQKK